MSDVEDVFEVSAGRMLQRLSGISVSASTVQRVTETADYVSPLPRARADAAQLLSLVHDDWGAIENGLHFVRETTFDEDRSTIFRGHAAENLAALRNTALNWLRQIGAAHLAATIRSFTGKSQRRFSKLGLVRLTF